MGREPKLASQAHRHGWAASICCDHETNENKTFVLLAGGVDRHAIGCVCDEYVL